MLIFLVAGLAARASVAEFDASTLYGKMIMGYQGWFGCPGDGSGRGWVHWMNAKHEPTVDLLPDVSEFDPDELCDSGWKDAAGKPIYLFSDQNAKTVDRHFKWMEDYGLDGVALQRFATGLRDPIVKRSLDKVLANVRAGAARHGRVWFLMYDLSGMPPDQYPLVVADWKAVLAAGATGDAGYQRHKGRPVLGLWGVGFAGRPMTPVDAQKLMADLRAETFGGLTILGGVPTQWREGKSDASADPGWAKVWPEIDVISPWTVGRYVDDKSADAYAKTLLAPDVAKAKAMGVDLMPVVFPGFSWANLMRARGELTRAIPDQIPRRCGAFFVHQAFADAQAGARMAYGAMFDELDEGTAVLKLAAPDSGGAPLFTSFSCDGDGASDVFLKRAGVVERALQPAALNRVADIPYGSDPQQKLDICLPKLQRDQNAVVVLLHGGGWSGGSKDTIDNWCQMIADRGAVALNVDYRLVNGRLSHIWPAQIEDVDKAIRWFVETFDTVKAPQFCLLGFSAGSQIAVKFADANAASSKSGPVIRCVVDNFGPINLSSTSGDVKRSVCRLVGETAGPECERRLAAASKLKGDEAGRSFLIVQGNADKLVDVSQARELAPKLQALGAQTRWVEYHGGHSFEGLTRSEIDEVVKTELDFVTSALAR